MFPLTLPNKKVYCLHNTYTLEATGTGEINHENVFIEFKSTTQKVASIQCVFSFGIIFGDVSCLLFAQ